MMTETEGHSRHFDGKIFVEKKVLSLHYFETRCCGVDVNA